MGSDISQAIRHVYLRAELLPGRRQGAVARGGLQEVGGKW